MSIGSQFIEKTKYKYLGKSEQQKGSPQPPLEAPFNLGGRTLELPSHDSIQSDLKKIIGQRRSVRKYQDAPINQPELSYLLWCTQGVKEVTANNYATRRTVPSAGARHAFETLLLINQVEGFASGLYRYLALDHKLEEYNLKEDIAYEITRASLDQDMVNNCAVTFIWVADIGRMTWRYGQRGYRYIFLDAGHVCQNLYLAAEAIGCGVCAIGAYDDDAINQILDLDGETKFTVYMASLGHKLTNIY
jgi:SagB-type dehydrogenase family enzyme